MLCKKCPLLKPTFLLIALTFVPIALLIAGLVLGALEGLQPCYLCNFQRFLYLLTSFFALFGLIVKNKVRRVFAALAALSALWGVISAAQQSWMQYAPDPSLACGFGPPTIPEQIVDFLASYLPSLFMVTGDCFNKEWVFLNLSLANWSGLCFFGLFLLALFLMFQKQKDQHFSN